MFSFQIGIYIYMMIGVAVIPGCLVNENVSVLSPELIYSNPDTLLSPAPREPQISPISTETEPRRRGGAKRKRLYEAQSTSLVVPASKSSHNQHSQSLSIDNVPQWLEQYWLSDDDSNNISSTMITHADKTQVPRDDDDPRSYEYNRSSGQLLIPMTDWQVLMHCCARTEQDRSLLTRVISQWMRSKFPHGPPLVQHPPRILFEDVYTLRQSLLNGATHQTAHLTPAQVLDRVNVPVTVWPRDVIHNVGTFRRSNYGSRFCLHFMQPAMDLMTCQTSKHSYEDVWSDNGLREKLVAAFMSLNTPKTKAQRHQKKSITPKPSVKSDPKRRKLNKVSFCAADDNDDDNSNVEEDDDNNVDGDIIPRRDPRGSAKFIDNRLWRNAYHMRFGTGTNFLPVVARQFYEMWPPGTVKHVLDPCAGFGGRLLGAWTSRNIQTYVGIDPNTRLQQPYQQMIRWLQRHFPYAVDGASGPKTATVICQPAEDVSIDSLISHLPLDARSGENVGYDLAFTSPPYFTKEQYNNQESTQSNIRYPLYDQWRNRFLFPMMRLCYNALRQGGILAINIMGAPATSNQPDASLCADVCIYALQTLNMSVHSLYVMPIKARPSDQETMRSRQRYEPVFVFCKS